VEQNQVQDYGAAFTTGGWQNKEIDAQIDIANAV